MKMNVLPVHSRVARAGSCAICTELPGSMTVTLHSSTPTDVGPTTMQLPVCPRCEPVVRSFCVPLKSFGLESSWASGGPRLDPSPITATTMSPATGDGYSQCPDCRYWFRMVKVSPKPPVRIHPEPECKRMQGQMSTARLSM